MKLFKRITFYLLGGVLLLGLFVILSNSYIKSYSSSYIYSSQSINDLPVNNVGLVLGTSKYWSAGGINPYFSNRMLAASRLYREGKIKHIIVSGDNHVNGYNEPQQMKDYLIDLGVSSDHITLDYAGFRTFDSMIRGKEVFGQTSFTIISQEFHNQRAVFIARKNGIDAVAYNAKSPRFSKRMKVREVLAKFKAMLDVYILPTQPKFLGEKIEINF